MKSTDIEYSIILPCLNEEKTLGICKGGKTKRVNMWSA